MNWSPDRDSEGRRIRINPESGVLEREEDRPASKEGCLSILVSALWLPVAIVIIYFVMTEWANQSSREPAAPAEQSAPSP